MLTYFYLFTDYVFRFGHPDMQIASPEKLLVQSLGILAAYSDNEDGDEQ